MNDVRDGQLWEALERLFYIVKVVRMDFDPKFDVYRYIEFSSSTIITEGHLTIRREDPYNVTMESFNVIWKRLA